MTSAKYAMALLAGASTIALATFANAQTAPTAVNEIVVTGSRVITNGNNSPTPVTVVPVEDVLRLQPTTVADALNELPVFSGQRNQFSNPGGGTAANNGGGNSGSNNLNLRNMGTQRTLILFDGLRVPSTSTSGVVDVDMVPQMLLQRVDVVTGGASAVYGSDAVTGVVNFITDRSSTASNSTPRPARPRWATTAPTMPVSPRAALCSMDERISRAATSTARTKAC